MTTQSNNPIVEAAKRLTRINKIAGMVAACIAFITGAALLFMPESSVDALEWVGSIGLFGGGCYYIYTYAKAPTDRKNGWNLVYGIITIVLGILLMFNGPLLRADSFAFMFSVIALSAGINQCMAYVQIKKARAKGRIGMLVAGIMNLCIAAFFMFAPFIMIVAFGFIAGFYLMFFGIMLFAQSFSGSNPR